MTFLEITAEQRDAANAMLAAAGVHHRVNPVEDNEGTLLLNADMIEDIDTNYAAACEVLQDLPIVERGPEDFPPSAE